jgi:hypothetical protein
MKFNRHGQLLHHQTAALLRLCGIEINPASENCGAAKLNPALKLHQGRPDDRQLQCALLGLRR